MGGSRCRGVYGQPRQPVWCSLSSGPGGCTDADWVFIRSVWAGEKIRGESDGIYRMPDKDDDIPPVPGGEPEDRMTKAPGVSARAKASGSFDETEIHKQTESRSALLNLMAREYGIRHLTHWMGDQGWLQNIRWSIMDRRAHQAFGKTAPLNPEAEHYLDRVPSMKGKYVNVHGLTGDIGLVKSYVTDKYVRDGRGFVELGGGSRPLKAISGRKAPLRSGSLRSASGSAPGGAQGGAPAAPQK